MTVHSESTAAWLLVDNHPNALGTVGFMRRDYVNFGFDQADVLLCVSYELQEFSPAQINPTGDKQIIHIHTIPAEVDDHYTLAVGIEGNIALTLDALAQQLTPKSGLLAIGQKIRAVLQEERENMRLTDKLGKLTESI